MKPFITNGRPLKQSGIALKTNSMSTIILNTTIKAPQQRVFDLARNIDLHTQSMENSKEQVIGGVSHGPIEKGDEVKFKAKHFGVWHKHASIITELDFPNFFIDEMTSGRFKYLKHVHWFGKQGEYTLMQDVLQFASPFSVIGKSVDAIFLKNYLRKIVDQRNQVIKAYAESDQWKTILEKEKR
jgi:ligand-binding SRPBCC domain-containing protein